MSLAFDQVYYAHNWGETLRDLNRLEQNIGYVFRDKRLLEVALTHASCAGSDRSLKHNQRLEFLGDSVLSLCVSQWLYTEHPELPEGQLTRLRAILVQETTLAEVGFAHQVEQFIRVSRGEELSGGGKKPSVVADAVEALIAAIFLDGGLENARAFILGAIKPRLEAAKEGQLRRDCKSELQEIVRKRWPDESPAYSILEEWGPPHERMFKADVRFLGKAWGEGEGKSKKIAEQRAALAALNQL